MLRRLAVTAAAVIAIVGSVLSTPSWAETKTVCPPPGTPGDCVVVVIGGGDDPGTGDGGSDGGGSSGEQVCKDTLVGKEVPCYLDGYGWWSPNCYYQLMNPQPPKGDPLWDGHDDGAVYETYCPDNDNNIGTQWLLNPPAGFGGGVDPGALAAEAAKNLPIRGATIGSAPPSGDKVLVGVPVWLWTAKSATTWGPSTATATAGGISATAIANATKIVWSMGDGSSVTCTSPGTPYKSSYGGTASPDCGYVYTTVSTGKSGGKFTITATTYWDITWTATTGASGTLPLQTRTSQTTARVGELQVVN